ncbi:hypothetical protein AVEN_227747-1 [Araneus ventricosus]|uniref:Uncharacterized protein n=1 Tax=Araneus ventricosus TaxID=182803 RepID=A0A4Y2LPZ1_ARAVE|nr:hypothetical protein AVEN_227747-1 [Araneus ventricosus]
MLKRKYRWLTKFYCGVMKSLVLSRTLENIRKGSDVTACDVGKRAFWLEEEEAEALGVLYIIEGGKRVFWFLASREVVSGCPVNFFGLGGGQNKGPGRGSYDGWNDEIDVSR